jgi:hypothetical protein
VAAKFGSYVQPRRLFRYRRIAKIDQELDALEAQYLYCAAYADLNDPMEGRYTFSKAVRHSSGYHGLRRELNDKKAQTGICSFSEVHDHELMWAHYAEQFTGFCVAYSLRRLMESLPDSASFMRMYYNEWAPTVHLTSRPTDELAKMVLSYKSYRWLYEREWRMFAQQGQIHYSDPKCVTRVYLGARMKPAHRARITRTLKRLGIKTSAMKIDEYFMTFDT